MKRLVLAALIAGLSLAAAGEFLGLVPDATPVSLAADYRIVGVTANGVLVVGDDSRASAFAALSGHLLAAEPRDGAFYRVRLLEPAARAELARITRILDFDGTEYVVELTPGTVDDLMKLPAEKSRINLRGWVTTGVTPTLPKVLANPVIVQLVASVSPDSILAAVRRLQNYRNRYSTGESCRAAADWIKAKYEAYGCDSVFLQSHTTGHAPNVVGIKYGTAGRRDLYAVIDGHFDDYAASNAPGADDNASGAVSTIEACRVMQGARFTNDLHFIAFSGEEFGLYGSDYYATRARSDGDSILGVLNFDMIGYVDVAPENLDMLTKIADPPCAPFSNWFVAVADTYTALPCSLQMVSDNQNSDHGPFWNNGYVSFCGIEDFWPTNPHYHTPHDSIGAGYNNNDFCTEVIKTGVAALATLGQPVPLNQPLVGVYRERIDDAAGNNNGYWNAGESVGVYLTLKNFGTVPATGVNATVSTTDPYVTLFGTSSGYGTINGQDTALPSAPFTMSASPGTPREHMANFDVVITSAETTWHNTFSLQIGQYLITDPIPDNYYPGPPFYWAYDDVDTAYFLHPTYEWAEIRGVGTPLALSDDETQVVTIPAPFAPIEYYGQEYNHLSICSNGWVALGSTSLSTYTNTSLPDAGMPPMIALNWDDLYPPAGGSIWYYGDTANGRFIIEYDSIPYYDAQDTPEWFELIISRSGSHSALCAQYRTANQTSSATVGIQDPTSTVFIQCLYNGTYTHGAAPIVAGRAINYAVDRMAVEEQHDARARAPRLTVSPNPSRSATGFRLTTGTLDPTATLGLYDAAGRLLRSFDTRNSSFVVSGIPAGVYIIRLTSSDMTAAAKAVVTR